MSGARVVEPAVASSTRPTPAHHQPQPQPQPQHQHQQHNNKRPTLIIYPTVSPESVVIPIVSCILGFPLLALLVICCLRRRAKLARERDRRRAGNCDTEAVGAMSLARFSPMHRLGVYLAGPGVGRGRAVSLRSERAMSRAFPSLELDTVVEERSEPESISLQVSPPEEEDNSAGRTLASVTATGLLPGVAGAVAIASGGAGAVAGRTAGAAASASWGPLVALTRPPAKVSVSVQTEPKPRPPRSPLWTTLTNNKEDDS